jgi:hypothetical protein
MQLKNGIKDEDILEFRVQVNGSFGDVITLTGKEFKKLAALLQELPVTSAPVVDTPTDPNLKAGDDIAEKRGE